MDKKRIAFFQEDLGPGGIQKSLFIPVESASS